MLSTIALKRMKYWEISLIKPEQISIRNQRRPKWVEKSIMFMDWKTQHSKDFISS